MNILPAHVLLPAGLFAAAVMFPAAAEPPAQPLQPVQVRAAPAIRLVFDCAARTLPSQRLVGEILDQHNFSQVYDSRARLMAVVGRACQRPHVERVGLVLQQERPEVLPADRRVARQGPTPR